jgi:hypothetical protein
MHASRARIEQEFKGLLLDKEAESARLHAEIVRLRSALTQAQSLQASQALDLQQMQRQVQQATEISRWVRKVLRDWMSWLS